MNIIKAHAKLWTVNGISPWEGDCHKEISRAVGVNALRCIEFAGRISHRSEDAVGPDSWERFIKAVVMGHGDWSIVEHVTACVDMTVDRGITHELVRHRLFSYTQESTRFVNYEKKMPPSFIEPPGLTDDVHRAPNGEATELSTRQLWSHSINTAESVYKQLLQRGLTPQIARSVFPNALASRIMTTGNLRNWRHFFIMRSTLEAHPQMKEVTIPLLQQFKDCIPLLYDDIQPNSRQVDNLKLPR